MYGLCDSFYGFYGLDPNALNQSSNGSSLFGLGGAGADGDGDRRPYYAHCSETPEGCYYNNYTSVWQQDAPKVRHPVAGAPVHYFIFLKKTINASLIECV